MNCSTHVLAKSRRNLTAPLSQTERDEIISSLGDDRVSYTLQDRTDLERARAVKNANIGGPRTASRMQAYVDTLEDGETFTLGGLTYVIDLAAIGVLSAGFDLSIDGVAPFGDVYPEHYGFNSTSVDAQPFIQRALDLNKTVHLLRITYPTSSEIAMNQEGNQLLGAGANQSAPRTTIMASHTSGAIIRYKARSASIHYMRLESDDARRANGDTSCLDIRGEQDDDGGPSRTSRPSLRELFCFGSPSHSVMLVGGQEHGIMDTVVTQDAVGHGFVFTDGTLLGRTNTAVAPFEFKGIACRATECGGHAALIGNIGQSRFPQKITLDQFEALGCAWNPDTRTQYTQIIDLSRSSSMPDLDIESQTFAATVTAQGSVKIAAETPPRPLYTRSDGSDYERPYISSFTGGILVDSGSSGVRITKPIFIRGEYDILNDYGVEVEEGAVGTKITGVTELMFNGVADPKNFVLCDERQVEIKLDGIPYYASSAPENTFILDKTFKDETIASGELGYISSLYVTVNERDRSPNPQTGADNLTRISASDAFDEQKIRLRAAAGETITVVDSFSATSPKRSLALWGSDIAVSGDMELRLRFVSAVNSFVLYEMIDANGNLIFEPVPEPVVEPVV